MSARPLIVAFALASVGADGSRKAETPPLAGAALGPPCRAMKQGCTPSGRQMAKTSDGLQECTEFYAPPGTCRALIHGVGTRPRMGVVKRKGQWLQCERPDPCSRCVGVKSRPNLMVR